MEDTFCLRDLALVFDQSRTTVDPVSRLVAVYILAVWVLGDGEGGRWEEGGGLWLMSIVADSMNSLQFVNKARWKERRRGVGGGGGGGGGAWMTHV